MQASIEKHSYCEVFLKNSCTNSKYLKKITVSYSKILKNTSEGAHF